MPDDQNSPKKIDPSTIKVPGDPPRQRVPEVGLNTQKSPSTEPEVPTLKAAPSPSVTPHDTAQPAVKRNPLRRFSLLGQADEIEANAAETKPLLGKFVMKGQATMIYAEPNTGKTLITLRLCLDAIEAMRIDPNNLYYVNADDSSAGLSTKVRLMQDVGAHMLVPGYNGFRTDHLVKVLVQAIDEGAARDTCVIIDTLKKFTDLMHKTRTSDFAQSLRRQCRLRSRKEEDRLVRHHRHRLRPGVPVQRWPDLLSTLRRPRRTPKAA